MKSIIIIILSVLLIYSCSPVRTQNKRVSIQKDNSSEKQAGSEVQSGADIAKVTKNRFSDTTVIYLPTVMQEVDFSLDDDLDNALQEFEMGKFDDACSKFDFLVDTFHQGDSLWHESKYYQAECFILENNLDDAAEIIEELIFDDSLPLSILERCLVRYGQILCIEKKFDDAQRYFKRLKQQFPNSIYLGLANCEVVLEGSKANK